MSINRLDDLWRCADKISGDASVDSLSQRPYACSYESRRGHLVDTFVNGLSTAINGRSLSSSEDEEVQCQNKALADCFDMFMDVKKVIDEFRKNNQELNRLTDELAVSSGDSRGISRMFKTISVIQNRSLIAIKCTIEQLQKSNELLTSQGAIDSDLHISPFERRLRLNLTAHLLRLTSDAAACYQKSILNHNDELQKRSERRTKLLWAAENDDMVTDSHWVTFIEPVLENDHTGSIEFCCDELQDKLRDVKKLENNVNELHSLFVDLATLVDQGQELTDCIEFEMLTAADYATDTNQVLAKAKIAQRKRNKRAMRFSGVFVVILLSIILSIVLSATKQ